MPDDTSWMDGLSTAAKGALTALEASAIIAGSPASGFQDVNPNYVLADPLQQAAITTMAEGHDALESLITARAESDAIGEQTDVVREQTTSLMVDPPVWASDVGSHGVFEDVNTEPGAAGPGLL